eukprot:TRINITY_DN57015_c0_g1_i1.p1 TRINITY_DN57015_c0_g1~~TRINITY_DN57015_c0_g1_i1.p1  ORF type:complete len:354 (+),score=42.21 TRINITY_DN57015_c0_g1_i1:61-1122(+)
MSAITDAQMKDAFELFDTDKTGYITESELGMVLQALGYGVLSPEEVKRMLKTVDRQGSGRIAFKAFRELVLSTVEPRDSEAELVRAFNLFDQDGRGLITAENFMDIAHFLGERVDYQAFEELIAYAGDGGSYSQGLDLHAWKRMMAEVDHGRGVARRSNNTTQQGATSTILTPQRDVRQPRAIPSTASQISGATYTLSGGHSRIISGSSGSSVASTTSGGGYGVSSGFPGSSTAGSLAGSSSSTSVYGSSASASGSRSVSDESAYDIKTRAKVASKYPYKAEVEKGRNYYWCSCGYSKTQPYCDGSHKRINAEQGTSYRPVLFQATEDTTLYFCGCKQTKNPPFCDGTHDTLL